ALVVDLVSAEGVGHVGAGGPVVVLDQRVDLEALDAAQLCPGVVRHRVAVPGVGRVLVGAVEVAAGGEPEASAGAGREDHRPGPDGDELAAAGVKADRADGPPVDGEYAHR